MKVEITAFGIAKDILKQKRSSIELEGEFTVSALRSALVKNYPDFSKLASLRFAVNEEYVADDHPLTPNDEIVLIPPVSGG